LMSVLRVPAISAFLVAVSPFGVDLEWSRKDELGDVSPFVQYGAPAGDILTGWALMYLLSRPSRWKGQIRTTYLVRRQQSDVSRETFSAFKMKTIKISNN
jgi:hypothetical protein